MKLSPCFIWAFSVAFLASPVRAQPNREDFNVVTRWPRYTDAGHLLYHALADQGMARLQQRAAEVERLHTTGEWRQRQRHVQRVLEEEIMGPFPARTPLNARVTGVIRRPGYRVEKV